MNEVSRRVVAKIDQLRKRHGYSVRTLAEELQRRGHDISESVIYTLNGRSTGRVTVDQLVAFASVFGKSLDELVLGDVAACFCCLDWPPRGMTCNKCGKSGGSL